MLYDIRLTAAQAVAVGAWAQAGAGMADVWIASDPNADGILVGQGDDRAIIRPDGTTIQ